MKTIICIISFLSFSAFAQEYKAPQIQQLKWKGPTSQSYQNNESWDSNYGINDTEVPADKVETESQIRKPSSGDESSKPKFWDFKVVK